METVQSHVMSFECRHVSLHPQAPPPSLLALLPPRTSKTMTPPRTTLQNTCASEAPRAEAPVAGAHRALPGRRQGRQRHRDRHHGVGPKPCTGGNGRGTARGTEATRNAQRMGGPEIFWEGVLGSKRACLGGGRSYLLCEKCLEKNAADTGLGQKNIPIN